MILELGFGFFSGSTGHAGDDGGGGLTMGEGMAYLDGDELAMVMDG